jgi:hypothetical protein
MQNRQVQVNSAAYFERLLRRCRGLTTPSLDPGNLREIWDVRDLMHEAESLFLAVARGDSSPLLKDVSRIGRLQQLEEIAIRGCLLFTSPDKGRFEAARIAIRMLVEDQYVLESAFSAAAEALMATFHDSSSPLVWSDSAVAALTYDLRAMARHCKRRVEAGKNIVICLDTSLGMKEVLSNLQTRISKLCEEICGAEDFLSFVFYSDIVDRARSSLLEEKCVVIDRLREVCANQLSASGTANTSLALDYTIELVRNASSVIARGNDTWIILVTNGNGWTGQAALDSRLAALSRERWAAMKVVVLGVNFDDAMMDRCSVLGRRKDCLVISTESDIPSLDDAFFDAAVHIQGRGSIDGLTMEKF